MSRVGRRDDDLVGYGQASREWDVPGRALKACVCGACQAVKQRVFTNADLVPTSVQEYVPADRSDRVRSHGSRQDRATFKRTVRMWPLGEAAQNLERGGSSHHPSNKPGCPSHQQACTAASRVRLSTPRRSSSSTPLTHLRRTQARPHQLACQPPPAVPIPSPGDVDGLERCNSITNSSGPDFSKV